VSESVYSQLRDQTVQAMIDYRYRRSERDLLRRMQARHEIVRNGTSPNLEPRQLTFEADSDGAA
jgi:hypothetical protein